MSEPRIIKKYPNRRLYDTVESRYITLGDVRKLVVERIDFVVMDKKTQEDITNSILLQVIADQEHGGEPLMSREFLAQIIRSYGGGAMQGVIGCYLEQSLRLFANHQREVRERAKTVVGTDPQDAVVVVAQKNFQRWRSLQDEIFRSLMDASPRARSEAEDAGISPSA
ncbi:MAG TPA: polyhydroxyalkanoate synthesis repressor PhaR [Steroidobacteraceae bacterium]|nr:polyhydroxyalkanoate synthesis repressor PhaR [Steroidobacteraceae bacterium]